MRELLPFGRSLLPAALLAGLLAALPAVSVGADEIDLDRLDLPEGFRIELYAEGLPGVRFMALGPDDGVYVTLPGSGRVLALFDQDGDGLADRVDRIAGDLDRPHGIVHHDGSLWVAETGRIVRFPETEDGLASEPIVVVEGFPARGQHWTRTIGFSPEDGGLYLSIGSSCNVCVEKDPRRAAITRYEPDGSGERIYAIGLRNAVGFAWHPVSGELWATHNGRDWLGDDLPPEEIVNIVVEGGDYGWPYCYGNRIPNPEEGFDSVERCRETLPPAITDTAHSAPLGCAFYTGESFPREYRNDFFVAYHGSWNRSVPTGYKVVRVRVANGKPYEIVDFVTGFLPPEGNPIGRPVDLLVNRDGSLLVSDDYGDRIYRVSYPRGGGREQGTP